MHPDAPLRRLTIWTALAGYALVASGLPLPCGIVPPAASDPGVAKRLLGKDRSRPFPCMDKPCGCDTADRCFTSCCCHTPAETLAWARARGLETSVLAALERRAAIPLTAAPEEGSCCSGKPTAGCCDMESREQEVPARACQVTSGESRPGADEPPPPRRMRTVSLRAMLACGGIVAEWIAVGAAPPPPKVELSIDAVGIDRTIPADAVAAGSRAVPEPPPPRAA
jgi:hypothetical protein